MNTKEKKKQLFQILSNISDILFIFNTPTIIYRSIKVTKEDDNIIIQDASKDKYQVISNPFIIDAITEKINNEIKQRKIKEAKKVYSKVD